MARPCSTRSTASRAGCDSPLTRARHPNRRVPWVPSCANAVYALIAPPARPPSAQQIRWNLSLAELGRPNLPYARVKGLREMFYGDLEAQQDFLAENDPEACRTYYLQFGGESSDTVRDRMLATLTDIMLEPGSETVLAVGHGGANFNFLRAIQDPMPVLNAGWGNCTTCVYAFDEAHADEAPDGNGAGPWRLLDVVRL